MLTFNGSMVQRGQIIRQFIVIREGSKHCQNVLTTTVVFVAISTQENTDDT